MIGQYCLSGARDAARIISYSADGSVFLEIGNEPGSVTPESGFIGRDNGKVWEIIVGKLCGSISLSPQHEKPLKKIKKKYLLM